MAGTYSTDPKKSKDFSIRGSLNVSAAAGLKLRGEAGAGLEILSHDIKAGAGLDCLAGILGYAEATPIIGYREKPAAEGEDKLGEFFIRGELERNPDILVELEELLAKSLGIKAETDKSIPDDAAAMLDNHDFPGAAAAGSMLFTYLKKKVRNEHLSRSPASS